MDFQKSALLALALSATACTDAAPEFQDGPQREGTPRASDPLADEVGGMFARPLEVFFSRQDDVVALELQMIDRVIEERRAFGQDASCEDGENPYSIRYAVFSHGNTDIIGKLAQAQRECVDVQILVEDRNVFKEWSRFLVEDNGFDRVGSHTELDEQRRRTVDIVGVTQSKKFGLFHLKTRLFQTPRWRRLLTGSINPNKTSFHNDENLMIVNDQRIIDRYESAYETALATGHEGFENVWDDDASLNVVFTPEKNPEEVRAVNRIFEWIAEEEEQIVIMVFSLNNLFGPDFDEPGRSQSLVTLLRKKVEDGVPVYAIVDRKQSDRVNVFGQPEGTDRNDEDLLRGAGVKVFEVVNHPFDLPHQAMHHKTAILGRTRLRVITDASNWSRSALGSNRFTSSNVESVLFIDSTALDGGRTARRFLGEWTRILQSYARHPVAQIDPAFAGAEDPYQAVYDELTRRPGWPTVPVTFSVLNADARNDEGVWVRGGSDALGRWQAPAVPLTVRHEVFQRDRRSDNARQVPVGVCEWKFVAGPNENEIHWEQGDNRVGVVAPPPFNPSAPGQEPGETVEFDGTWRR